MVQPATLGIVMILRGRLLFWDPVGASPSVPIGSSHQPGRGYRAPAFIMPIVVGRALAPSSWSVTFPLRPLCVAQELGWCDHVCPRWGRHTLDNPVAPPCSAYRLPHRIGVPTLLGSRPSLCPNPMP